VPDSARMPRRNLRDHVGVDLKGAKPKWLAWCASVGLTPSEAFRQIVSRLELSAWPAQLTVAPVRSDAPRGIGVRRKITLSEAEWAAISTLAAQDQISASRWIASVVRSKLTGEPQLCWPEVDRLNVLIGNLNRVGALLNTAVRQVNEIAADRAITKRAGGELEPADDALLRLTEMGRERVESLFTQLQQEVAGTAEGVRVVLRANAARWKTNGPGASKP
jgi:hypothetical protein